MLAAAVTVGLGWFYTLTSSISTPHLTYLRWIPPFKTSFMKSGGDIAYTWVDLPQISPHLQQAVVLAEDDQFFKHPGFDIEAMKKAAKINWKRRKFSHGASTITMQLARNLYLSPRKSPWRKFREMLIALKLERELPKERILELYLNVAQWGNGIYGADAAARHYFNKGAALLTKHEAAFLAAILPKPSFYDRHREGSYLRKRISDIESRL